MKVVKEAFRTKGIADATLVTLLGGQNLIQRDPQTVIEKFVTDTLSLVTLSDVSPEVEDDDVPTTEGLYQLDVWAKRRDTADAIAERLVALYDKQAMTITGRRLYGRGVRHAGSFTSYEDDAQVHHVALTFRVQSIATT